MEVLEERIKKDGIVKPGNVLKVDSFLNHQMDPFLFKEMGKEWKARFHGTNISKILTIEASGIGIACVAALCFGLPVVFAKKSIDVPLDDSVYTTKVDSFTKNKCFDVSVSKKYLKEGDKVLIIDDFLANGCAVYGLKDLIEQAGAELMGVGIVIEKGFQEGGKKIREDGIRLESLAIIDSMDPETGEIKFRH